MYMVLLESSIFRTIPLYVVLMESPMRMRVLSAEKLASLTRILQYCTKKHVEKYRTLLGVLALVQGYVYIKFLQNK